MNAEPEIPKKKPNARSDAPDVSSLNGQAKTGVSTPAALQSLGSIMVAILLVSGFAEMAYGIVNFSAMPVYITAIGLDPRWISAVAAAYLITEGLLKSPFGILGDRFGRKRLLLIGPLISTFTAFLTPFVQNPYALILLRVLDGMGLAALWPSAFSLISDYAPKEKRAAAMSLFNVAYMVGIAFGPAIGGGINDAAQHLLHLPLAVAKQASFYAASILFGITVLIAGMAIPDVQAAHHKEAGLEAIEGGLNLADFKRMLGRMPVLLLMAFVTFLGVGLVMAYAKVFVMERFELNESAYGALLIAPALAIAAASVPLGTLGDRIGKVKAIQVGIGMCAVGFWMLLLLPTKLSLVILGSVIGVGFVIAFPALMALVSESCEANQRGAALGAIGTAQGLGAILGVAFSGFLYKLPAFPLLGLPVPAHGLPFLCCATMLATSFLLAVFGLKEPHRSSS